MLKECPGWEDVWVFVTWNARVPVGVMTGYGPADREERLSGGCVQRVPRKPLSSEMQFRTLSATLGS